MDKYESSLQTYFERLVLLAERLRVSTDQDEMKIWMCIGKELAQKEGEFRDFPISPFFEPPRGRGHPLKDELGAVEIAEAVQALRLSDPTIRTARAALSRLQANGFKRNTELKSLETSLSTGKRILRARQAEKQRRAAEAEARLQAGRRRKPQS